MKFLEQEITGSFVIIPEVHKDSRGAFFRNFCFKELQKAGVCFNTVQGNISENLAAFTLRGFHYQKAPSTEKKILTCISGSIFNVIIDIRKGSKTYGLSQSFKISSQSRQSILVPDGCANAYLSLCDNTTVQYYMSDYFDPTTYNGFRYDDPTFDIDWPCVPKVISEKDRNLGYYEMS